MNCKPGDLAVVVRAIATPELVGCIVRCVRLATAEERNPSWHDGATWLVSGDGRALPERRGRRVLFVDERFVRDQFLRPLRDQDGMDQTLEWKSVPRLPAKEIA